MDYELVAKMHVNILNNYLKVCGLKRLGNKNDLVAPVFLLWRIMLCQLKLLYK